MVQRIYTRTGDRGDTGLFGGGRVAKSSPRVEAYGEIDELNAVVGWAVSVLAEARDEPGSDGGDGPGLYDPGRARAERRSEPNEARDEPGTEGGRIDGPGSEEVRVDEPGSEGVSPAQHPRPSLRARVAAALSTLQPDLFVIGAHLATPAPSGARRPKLPPLPVSRVDELERWIDEAEQQLPPLDAFIMPGGSTAGAALHLARTVCRRAERGVVALAAVDPIDPSIVRYLNRLSDYLFVIARLVNQADGAGERRWEHEAG